MRGTRYIYTEIDGKIQAVMMGNLDMVKQNHRDGVVVDLPEPMEISSMTHYHKGDAIADRPVLVIPDVASINVPISIEGVPADVDIKVNNEVVGISDGSVVELMFDLDGEYEVSILPQFPYVPAKTTIKVSP